MPLLLSILLYPLALFYGTIMFLRNKLYDWKFFKSKSFDLPTISIGNLSLGGTGKTPHTEYIIRLLEKDHRISTLSRGYKRKSKGFFLASKNSTATEIGDEPLQFKLKFTGINVAVDEDRVHGIEQLKRLKPDTDLVILDDAFQHRAVKPGLSILITQHNKLYCDDMVIPSGKLREFKKGSNRADIIIVSKTQPTISNEEKNKIRNKLGPSTNQHLFFSHIKYSKKIPFTEPAKKLKLNPTLNPDVLLLTGIANPKPFFKSIANNYNTIYHQSFPDHHHYTRKDIDKIIKQFNDIKGNNKFIISTEKDIMRLSLPEIFNQIKDIPIFFIPIEVYFNNDDKMEFDKLIRDYVRKNKRDNNFSAK